MSLKAATISGSSRSEIARFAGHFLSENWPVAHFCSEICRILEVGKACTDGKMAKNWPFAHFLPTFIFKSGQAETVGAQGFAGFLATFPLFFLFNREKKYQKLYISGRKKWPSGQQGNFKGFELLKSSKFPLPFQTPV